jgi:hypothetical protein
MEWVENYRKQLKLELAAVEEQIKECKEGSAVEEQIKECKEG